MSWLLCWSYRKAHIINQQAGAGTNYQRPITVHYGVGADNGDDVYCGLNCKTDFGDIRFTADDGETELDYWMQEKTDSSYAIFWVKISGDLSSGPVTLYVYYGNSSATYTDDYTDLEHGENTFTFFDNFSTFDTNKWDESGSGTSVSSDGNILTIPYDRRIQTDTFFNAPLRFKGRSLIGTARTFNYFGLRDDSSPANLILFALYGDYNETNMLNDGSASTKLYTNYHGDINSPPAEYYTWGNYEILWDSGSDVKMTAWEGYDTHTWTHSQVPETNNDLGLYASGGDTPQYLDWAFIAKYVDPEPTHGSWGDQEQDSVIPFADGFETGTFDAWTTTYGSPAIVENYPNTHCNNYAASFDASGDYVRKHVGNTSPFYIRFYARWNANPANTGENIRLGGIAIFTGAICASLYLYNDGTDVVWRAHYRDSATDCYTNSSMKKNPSADRWYCIEMRCEQSATATWRFWIDGEELTDLQRTGNQGYGMLFALVGQINSNYTVTSFADCVIASDEYVGLEKVSPEWVEANFEIGNTSEFDGTLNSPNETVTASTDFSHHGTYSCKCDVNTAGDAYAEGYFDIAKRKAACSRGYFRLNRLPNLDSAYTLISFENTEKSKTVGYVQLFTDGAGTKWKILGITNLDYESTSETSMSNIPTTDQWVCIDFVYGVYNQATSNFEAQLWINGELTTSISSVFTDEITRVHIGVCDSATAADAGLDLYLDCVVARANANRVGVETNLEVNDLTVKDILTIKAPNGGDCIDVEPVMIGPDPILQINQGIMATKDIACYGYVSAQSPTLFVFNEEGYTHCASSDIGKCVNVNGEKLSDMAILVDYNNTYRKWWLSSPHEVSSGSTITIVNGKGAGTLYNDSEVTRGGAIMIGQGFEHKNDPPRINLVDSGDHELCITAGSTLDKNKDFIGVDPVLANMKLARLTANNLLKLANNSPQLSNEQMVKEVYWFENGIFSPVEPPTGTSFPDPASSGDLFNRTDLGLFYQYDGSDWVSLGSNSHPLPTGLSAIQLKDNESNNFLNLFLTISSDNYDNPILTTDQSVLVKKDVSVGGFLGSNQGALMLGSGLTSQVDEPKILLMNSAVSRLQGGGPLSIPAVPTGSSYPGSPISGQLFVLTTDEHLYQYNGSTWDDKGAISDYAGNFDTLHVTTSDGSTLANLKLETLNCGLIAYTDGKTRLACMDDGVVAVQSFVDDTWYAGTLDASNVFVDHINSLSGEGITIFDPILYFGIDQDTKLYRSEPDTLKTDDDFVCEALTANDHIHLVDSSSLITRQQLLDHLYKVGQTPDEFDWGTIPQYLKFYNQSTGISAYMFCPSLSDGYNEPVLYWNRALAVRKDIITGGRLDSMEGVVSLLGGVGWGPDGYNSNPFIWLVGNQHGYPEKDTLEIRTSTYSGEWNWGWGNIAVGDLTANQMKIQSTNNAFAVTAGDNGLNQDTYLIPQNPSEGGLGLGTQAYPFKWIDATTVFTNGINVISGDLTIYPSIVFSGGIKSSFNPTTDNTYGLGSGSYRWQGVSAVTGYFDQIQTTAGYPFVWALSNMPQGTNGYVLTAQGAGNPPVWASVGSVSVTWTEVPSSIIPLTNNTYDLGSNTYAWHDIFSSYGHIGDLTVPQALWLDTIYGLTDVDLTITPYSGRKIVVDGDLEVTGDIIGQATQQKGSDTTEANGVKTITFSEAFNSTPLVFVQAIDASGRSIIIDVTEKSTTQFSVKAKIAGTHKHKIGEAAATAGWTIGVSSEDSHTHNYASTTGVGSSHRHSVAGTTGVGSAHNHAYASTTGVATVSLGSTYSFVGGNTANANPTTPHYHGFDGNAAADLAHNHGTHTHNFSSYTGDESSHYHYYAQYTDYEASHTHNFSSTSGAGSSHTHSLTGGLPPVTLSLLPRGINMRDSEGAVYGIGSTLENEAKTATDLYTENSVLTDAQISFDWMAISA